MITDAPKVGPYSLEELGLTSALYDSQFDNLTRLAASIFGSPVSLVSIIEADEDRQFFKSHVGLDEGWSNKRQTPLSHSFCRLVVERDAPLVVTDSRNDPRVAGNGAIEDLRVASYLGVPIRLSGVALGALCVIEHSPREWTPKEVQQLGRLGECASDVIESKAVIRLSEELREECTDFAYALSEELREPTDVAHGLVVELMGSGLDDERRGLVEDLASSCSVVRSTIAGVQDYGHALDVQEEPTLIDLTQLVSEVAHGLTQESDAAVVVDPLPAVWGYGPQLELLFRAVLDNAMRYTRDGVAPSVHVSSESHVKDGQHRITIRDNGRGIHVDGSGRLFGLFTTCGDGPGPGLGLAIARRVAVRHGGQVQLDSDGRTHTVVTVSLPAR